MRHVRIKLSKCKIIFFDLEFYVPKSSRSESGFCYNPWDRNCRFLGGSFLLARPDKDFEITEEKVCKKINSLWLWDHQSERSLLESIHSLLNSAHETVSNAHNGMVSPVLCGIGITSSDVPILFELFKRYHILTNSEAFAFQNKFRIIDLSQISVAAFNNSSDFLYPNTKSKILNKYVYGKTFEPGKSVWEQYESKDYDKIESRVIDEIVSTYKSYKCLKYDFDNFKSLEKKISNLKKKIIRYKEQLDSQGS